MYETLENWKQYKQEKDLQAKIAKEFDLDNAINEQRKIAFDLKIKKAIKLAKWKKEFDEWMNNLIKKNGVTNY